MSENIHVIFDGPPGNLGGRFIEVENDAGAGIRVGEWKDRGDGTWELVIPKQTMLHDTGQNGSVHVASIEYTIPHGRVVARLVGTDQYEVDTTIHMDEGGEPVHNRDYMTADHLEYYVKMFAHI